MAHTKKIKSSGPKKEANTKEEKSTKEEPAIDLVQQPTDAALKEEDITMTDAAGSPAETPKKKGKKDKPKKDKKEKKEYKKQKTSKEPTNTEPEPEPEPAEAAATSSAEADSTAPTPSKKRKRPTNDDVPELEIDVNAPVPPSKKALRKLKKSKSNLDPASSTTTTAVDAPPPKPSISSGEQKVDHPEHSSQARSQYGIWIGNLTFATTKPQLEDFFTKPPSSIPRIELTRINLPIDHVAKKNKGFAYIDFSTETALTHALSLSEKLFNGRKVLIKNAKDFSNRNASISATAPNAASRLGPNLSSKPPSRILFCGNLDFETKDTDLRTHFAFAGNIINVRLANFEDSGKCKGFAFVDFEDEDSVKRAMLGLSLEEIATREKLEGKEEAELDKKAKKRKFMGTRMLKMEYGEDPSVRYKKRFGKDKPEQGDEAEEEGENEVANGRGRRRGGGGGGGGCTEIKDRKPAFEPSSSKKQPRLISSNPGAAYADDVKRTGAITESTGKRTKFA